MAKSKKELLAELRALKDKNKEIAALERLTKFKRRISKVRREASLQPLRDRQERRKALRIASKERAFSPPGKTIGGFSSAFSQLRGSVRSSVLKHAQVQARADARRRQLSGLRQYQDKGQVKLDTARGTIVLPRKLTYREEMEKARREQRETEQEARRFIDSIRG